MIKQVVKKEQVQELISGAGVVVQANKLLARCSKCNGNFIPRPIPKAELLLQPEKWVVGQQVVDNPRITEFWCCEACHKVFWQGVQFRHAMEVLSEKMKTISQPLEVLPAGGQKSGAKVARNKEEQQRLRDERGGRFRREEDAAAEAAAAAAASGDTSGSEIPLILVRGRAGD